MMPKSLPFWLAMLSLIGVAAVAQAAPPAFDRARAQATCADKWTKRGQLDPSMYGYCMERQQEGYDRALDLYQKYTQIDGLDKIVAYAAGKWLTRREYQYEMVAYEIEQQGEAFLDVAYDFNAKTYTRREVEACVSKWIRKDEPQWTMVAYCLENGR